jgi:hypothetical protein
MIANLSGLYVDTKKTWKVFLVVEVKNFLIGNFGVPVFIIFEQIF